MSQIDPEPDRAWLDRLAGTYADPIYGKVTIRVEGDRGIFDAGELKGSIGRKREEDGSIKLVLTNAPYTRWPDFVVQETGGKITLTLVDGQRKIVFEPVKPGK
jgi:hypothetical protein